MKDPQVDADKIFKHIKYTRHWLDKANDDFTEQRFASGGIVLNLARAELTAAWEEVMQLKTQVTKNLPRKARTHWKPLSSVGLLAAGFFIALFLTRMTNEPLPNLPRTTDAPAIVQEFIPVMSTEPVAETIPEKNITTETPAAETTASLEAVIAPAAEKPVVRKPARKVAAKRVAPAIIEKPEPAPVKIIEEPAVLPYTPVGNPAPALSETSAAEDTQLENTEIIELFNTAQKTLHK